MKLKLSTLQLIAGIAGLAGIGIFLSKYPIFMYYTLILILPCFGLTYLLKFDFTLLERILISFFTGSLFLIPIDFLSNLNIPINPTTILLITLILPLLITYFLKKHVKLEKNIINSVKEKGWTIFSILIIILITFYIWQPLLQGEKLPMTDQVINFALVKEELDEINNHSRIPFWGSDFSGGYPIFLFNSYFYYERLATLNIILPDNFSIVYLMNTHAFLSVIILGLGIFALAKRFGMNNFQSTLSVLIFNINPFLASKFGYSGDIKELTAFAVLPLIFLVFTLKKPKKFILLALLLSFLYYSHLILCLFVITLLAIYYALEILIQKKISKSELKHLLVGVGLTFLLISPHAVPLFLNRDYPLPLHRDVDLGFDSLQKTFIKPYTSEPTDFFSYNTGIYFILLGAIGLGSLILKNKFHEKPQLLLYSFIILLLIMTFVPFIGHKLLGFIGSDRSTTTFILIIAMLAPLALSFSDKLTFKALAILTILIIVAHYAPITKLQLNNWVTETAQNGLFEQQYQKLENIEPGRLINYGIFAYATETAVPAVSNLGMITHTNPFGQHIDPQPEFKDGSESKLTLKYDIPYVINRMRTTFTKYVFIFKCDQGRQGWVTEEQFQAYEQPPFNLEKVHQEECITIYKIPKTNYVESAKISLISLPREITYNQTGGWKVIGFLNPEDYNKFEYDYTVDSISDVKVIPDPVSYESRFINNDHIQLNGEFKQEWIVVKDTYYKRWHAYMNGEELEIKESNLGTMLIKTNPGNQIDLINKPFAYELLFGAIGTALLLAIFIFPNRFWSKK